MGKTLVTSYAALGVGLAIVLTFGLTAISSVMEQPLQNQFVTSEPESMQMAPAVPAEAPAPPSEEQDVSAKAKTPAEGGIGGEAVTAKAPARQEEMAEESYAIATEVPASASPFAGFFMALPYIAAAAVGSVVFVVTKKRVGW